MSIKGPVTDQATEQIEKDEKENDGVVALPGAAILHDLLSEIFATNGCKLRLANDSLLP